MIDPDLRTRFVRVIRSMSTEEHACRLAEALEKEWEEADDRELLQLEALSSWRHGDLLEWALSHPVPPVIHASAEAIHLMREFRLIGDLARAAEQAMAKREHLHAERIVRLLGMTWRRVRGVQALQEACRASESVDGEGEAGAGPEA